MGTRTFMHRTPERAWKRVSGLHLHLVRTALITVMAYTISGSYTATHIWLADKGTH